MGNDFLLLVFQLIEEYKNKSGEKRFVSITDLINTSNHTTVYLLKLAANLTKPTLSSLIEHIEINNDFSLFDAEDKKMSAVILIYRYSKEINNELNIVEEKYLIQLIRECMMHYSYEIKNKTITESKPSVPNYKSKSKEIEIREEKDPKYLILGLAILIISIIFAQNKYNDIKGDLVGLGILVGLITTVGGFIYYKSE